MAFDSTPALQGAFFIDSPARFDALLEAIEDNGLWILDTEFERTDTYYPKLALLQSAIAGQTTLLDPLTLDAGQKARLRSLLERNDILKVLHSCGEDLEALAYFFDAAPAAVFDTQLAAAFLGHRWGLGYGALVETFLGLAVEKDETRSNWLRRPLSEAQQRYACLDVIYLEALWPQLRDQLDEQGRFPWAQEESDALLAEAAARGDETRAWLGLKSATQHSRRTQAALRELAAWRERMAKSLDRPRGRVLRDEHLLALARAPAAPERWASLEIPPGALRRWGEELAALLAPIASAPEASLPPALPAPPGREAQGALKALKAAAQGAAERFKLAPELLGRKKLLEAFYLEDAVPEAFLGWRKAVVLDALKAAKAGTP
ncbi:MAG: ribonuclease D [Pseudomonadales bacterium]|nr:ribonuclease D [Pseudomonadales bacterium]